MTENMKKLSKMMESGILSPDEIKKIFQIYTQANVDMVKVATSNPGEFTLDVELGAISRFLEEYIRTLTGIRARISELQMLHDNGSLPEEVYSERIDELITEVETAEVEYLRRGAIMGKRGLLG